MNEDWGYALMMTQLACEEVNAAAQVFTDVAFALMNRVSDTMTEIIDDDT